MHSDTNSYPHILGEALSALLGQNCRGGQSWNYWQLLKNLHHLEIIFLTNDLFQKKKIFWTPLPDSWASTTFFPPKALESSLDLGMLTPHTSAAKRTADQRCLRLKWLPNKAASLAPELETLIMLWILMCDNRSTFVSGLFLHYMSNSRSFLLALKKQTHSHENLWQVLFVL